MSLAYKMRKVLCTILGHNPIKIDTENFEATCSECGVKLEVSYDMSYGDTIVIKPKEER